MSIKQRITIAFGVLVAALLVLFSVFIYQTFESYRRTLMRTRLERRARAAEAYFVNRTEFLRSSYLALPDQHELLLDSQERRVYASAHPDDQPPGPELLARARTGVVHFTYSTPRWPYPKEGVALPLVVGNSAYVAVVTAYDLTGRQTSRSLLLILMVGNTVALLMIALVGWVFARRAMRPFDALIEQMDAATVDDFSFRLRRSVRPDEAGYLADSFNVLLDRLQALARSQKQFVAYASHELRTPLTVVKGKLETSLAYDQTLPAARQSMEEALRRLDGAIDLANNLLSLAEVEHLTPGRLRDEINVVDIVLDTVGYFGEKYPQQLLDVQLTDAFTEHSPHVRVLGSTSLLRTALVNIIDNACKYSEFRPVSLRIDYDPAQAETLLETEDQGIGIPGSELPNVYVPLMRGGNVGAVPGFGLGLTLARKITDMHGGHLHIHSTPGQGTTVTLRLPAGKGEGE
jgi:two-component system sensor histidine kinase ArlS